LHIKMNTYSIFLMKSNIGIEYFGALHLKQFFRDFSTNIAVLCTLSSVK
jgi:hypothetical protein